MNTKQFHLKYWGGVQNNDLSHDFLETTATDFWFHTTQERQDFKNKLKSFADSQKQCVTFNENEGKSAQTNTVAMIEFIYKDNLYTLEYDFGVGYPQESAVYMFEDGNYACDCNRAMFINGKYPEFEDEMTCGDEIIMKSIRVELRPANVV